MQCHLQFCKLMEIVLVTVKDAVEPLMKTEVGSHLGSYLVIMHVKASKHRLPSPSFLSTFLTLLNHRIVRFMQRPELQFLSGWPVLLGWEGRRVERLSGWQADHSAFMQELVGQLRSLVGGLTSSSDTKLSNECHIQLIVITTGIWTYKKSFNLVAPAMWAREFIKINSEVPPQVG